MEPCKAITKKHFVSEEESNRDEVTLTPQDRISNIDWCECGYECKPIIAFVESFNLLLRLKSWSARRASHHSTFMGSCLTSSHTF